MHKPENILITGASSGIGAALAKGYARAGTQLILTGRNESRLNAVASYTRHKGADVKIHVIDVCEKDKMAGMLENEDSQTPIDLVIANAGISAGGGVSGFESFEQLHALFATNLYGVLNTVEPLLPRFIERKSGQIALMSSLASWRGWPGASAYSASKGAVRLLGEAWRTQYKPYGIKVNVICPGFIQTPMTDINPYKMPFLMPAEKAARIIIKDLSKNRGRIAFPWPTAFFAWLTGALPDPLISQILKKMPSKPNLES